MGRLFLMAPGPDYVNKVGLYLNFGPLPPRVIPNASNIP